MLRASFTMPIILNAKIHQLSAMVKVSHTFLVDGERNKGIEGTA
jgi:hypothetical protein